jgi:hypothetical protein
MRRKIRIAGFAMVWTGVLTLGIVAYQLVVTDILNGGCRGGSRHARRTSWWNGVKPSRSL